MSSTKDSSGSGLSESTLSTTLPVSDDDAPQCDADRDYLLVFEDDRSEMFALPEAGDVVIGRADTVDLRLSGPEVSRQHARMSIDGGRATIADLGSHNGTRVNDEPIAGSRPLVSGDSIRISTATLVYHSRRRASAPASMLELADLRRRVEEEVARASAYHRSFAVAALAMTRVLRKSPAFSLTLPGALRAIDAVSWVGPSQLLILMPELETEEARAACERLVALASERGGDVTAGLACFPGDGCDADTLIASARIACGQADPGAVAAAREAFGTFEVGGVTVVAADPASTRQLALIRRLAASDLPVLICGETGTGKEVAARALHEWSPRANGPLIAVNCAAIPEQLLESELFGHERGAFSGADASKPGRFEQADGGTVFLDEIAELSLPAQAKLLRVLESKEIVRIGGTRERTVDIRIVAATNRDLQRAVAARAFRDDLYFRLRGATVWQPPLRDRPRELPLLAQLFLDHACASLGREPMRIDDAAMHVLAGYRWPGNVRELKHVMGFCAAACEGDLVTARDLAGHLDPRAEPTPPPAQPARPSRPEPTFGPIEEEIRALERTRMSQALAATGGNQTKAAKLIHMPLRTFQAKVKQYGLRKPS